MARCTGCGAQLAAKARFCSLCGKEATPAVVAPAAAPSATRHPGAGAVSPARPAGAAAPVPAAGGRKNGALLATASALALVLALFFVLKASGLLGAKRTEVPSAPVLNAPDTQTATAPVLNAPRTQPATAPVINAPAVSPPPQAPILTPPTAKGNPMPEDVIAYLRWLKQFEAARHSLEDRGAAQLSVVAQELIKESMTGAHTLGTLDDDPTEPSSNKKALDFDFGPLQKVIADWNQATAKFQGYPPPNPCATLATNYNGALATSVREMSHIVGGFQSAMDSLTKSNGQPTGDMMQVLTGLKSEQRSHEGSKSIDTQYGDANAALDAVRDQYTNIPEDIDARHFQIKEENLASPLTGLAL
jgi:hypothetical protein